MVPTGFFCLRRGHTGTIFDKKRAGIFIDMHQCHRRYHHMSVTMGPVIASLAMYATKRMLSRLVAGQLFRKGIPRKIRRLFSMMTQDEVFVDLLQDFLEELMTSLVGII